MPRRYVSIFDKQGVRALVDDRNEKIGRKIRDNELKRVPYMVIVGEKESAEGSFLCVSRVVASRLP